MLSLLVLALLLPHDAQAAWLNPALRVQIKEACLARHHRPQALRFCGCVGTKHFRSAKLMPDRRRADHDLRWVLSYYRTRDPKILRRLRQDPDNLVAYDAFIGKRCRRTAG